MVTDSKIGQKLEEAYYEVIILEQRSYKNIDCTNFSQRV